MSVRIELYEIKEGYLQSALKEGDRVINLMVGRLPEKIDLPTDATILFENKERFFMPNARVAVFCSCNSSVGMMACSYEFFEAVKRSSRTTLEMMKKIDRISDWPPERIKRIRDNADCVVEENDREQITYISDPGELDIFYELQKQCYTKLQYRKIKSLFSDLKTSTRSETAEDTKKKLALLATVSTAQRSDSEKAPIERIASCFEDVPISDECKKALIHIVASYIISQSDSPQPIKRLLLTGHDTAVQDMVIEAIAKATSKSVFRKDISAISSNVVLKGMTSQYAGSRCGIISEGIVDHGGAANMLFDFRRIDRCSSVFSQDGATSDSVEELLKNDYFTDDWYGYPFSLHGSLFVCTAPDYQSVPKQFRDAFGNDVVNIPPIDEDKQIKVFVRSFKKIIKKFSISISGINRTAIYKILYEYTDGTVAKIEEISRQLAVAIKMSDAVYEVIDQTVVDTLLYDVGGDERMKFFRRNHAKYSDEQRDEILRLQDKIDGITPLGNRNELLECRDTLIGLIPQSVSIGDIDLVKAKRTLDEEFFGKESLKELLFSKMAASVYMNRPLSNTVILLYGPPGVGKTKIGELFAASINRKFVKISLNGAFAHDIKGQKDSPGLIASACGKVGTDAVILLDEVDKLALNGANALCDLLDDKQFHSNAFQSRIDFSKAIFVLSANCIENVPDFLQSRCETVYVSGYGFEDRVEIAKIFLRKFDSGTYSVEFSDEAMKYMVEKSIALEKDGVRKLGQLLADAVSSACADKYWNGTTDDEILVERRNVDSALKILDETHRGRIIGF